MEENDENPSHQSRKNGGITARNTLQSATGYLEASASAGAAGDGSRPDFSASFSALLEWGLSQNLVQDEKDFSFFSRKPDEVGHEHEVWFDETTNRWFKATHPNKFGLAWGRDEFATVTEYLTRLSLQNEHFGDDIQLVCLVNCGGRLRILISQPHIVGRPATLQEIQWWFANLGFVRLDYEGSVAWYLKKVNLLVADAHEGNVIYTPQGGCVPIDLNLVQPAGELKDWACRCFDEATGLPAIPESNPVQDSK